MIKGFRSAVESERAVIGVEPDFFLDLLHNIQNLLLVVGVGDDL